MHSKSDNIQIVINDRVDEIIEELFSITALKGSDFIFTVFLYCIINIIKEILNEVDHI